MLLITRAYALIKTDASRKPAKLCELQYLISVTLCEKVPLAAWMFAAAAAAEIEYLIRFF